MSGLLRVQLRVGVDAGVFRAWQAGIARYVRGMIREMLLLAPDCRFFLYSTTPVNPVLPPGNWQLRIDGRLSAMPAVIWMQLRLPELLADDQVDVFWGQSHMLPLRLAHRCARVLTLHDLTACLYPRTMRITTRIAAGCLQASAARRADRVIAVSAATAGLAETLLGVSRERMRVVYEGCGIEDGRGAVGSGLGLSPGYLLVVGTIEPRKDHETLFRALEAMSDAPLLVVVGGVGWRCRSILARMKGLENLGRVRYVGRVDDAQLGWLYRNARLLVCPSRYEGFGLPVLEAMGHGCPVVCSWSSSLPEVGGAAARYFRVGDHEGLARLLERLLSSPAELDAMMRAGREQAAKFSFATAAAQVLEQMCGAVGAC